MNISKDQNGLTQVYPAITSLAKRLSLAFTGTLVLYKTTRDDLMATPLKPRKSDSHVDAWAILFMIILVVATAVFWVSHQ